MASLQFKYLGLSVGGNPQHASTWASLVDELRSRLVSRKIGMLVLEAELSYLTIYVLRSIHVFYPSFVKMPNKVWKSVFRTQRNSWGRGRGGWGEIA